MNAARHRIAAARAAEKNSFVADNLFQSCAAKLELGVAHPRCRTRVSLTGSCSSPERRSGPRNHRHGRRVQHGHPALLSLLGLGAVSVGLRLATHSLVEPSESRQGPERVGEPRRPLEGGALEGGATTPEGRYRP